MAKTLKTLSPTNRVGPAAAADSAGPPPEGYFASSTEESFLADWREAKARWGRIRKRKEARSGIPGLLQTPGVPQSSRDYYPPALTGMRGSHEGLLRGRSRHAGHSKSTSRRHHGGRGHDAGVGAPSAGLPRIFWKTNPRPRRRSPTTNQDPCKRQHPVQLHLPALSDLFIVYNEPRYATPENPVPAGRGLIVKFTRMFAS